MLSTTRKTALGRVRHAIAAGALLVLPALTLAACGGEEDDAAQEAMTIELSSTSSSSPTHQPDPTEASESEEEPTTERDGEDDADDDGDVLARCDDDVVQQSPGFEDMVVNRYCDGLVMEAGVPNTDHLVLAVWEDGEWQKVRPAGTSPTNFPCFDEDELESLGFPAAFIEKKPICKDD